MSDGSLMSPEEVAAGQAQAMQILDGLNVRLLGQHQLTRMVLVGCLARGHVLLEGLPGLGKTELIKGLAGLLGLAFRRIQFTPDLLPGDITGGQVLQETDGQRTFVFHRGPIFGNLILADEINRASPRTQSALLEAMAERRVTVLGESHALPDPFWVLATQNPIELEGTYALPEAQLDRFLFKLHVHRVDAATMKHIVMSRRQGRPPQGAAVLSPAALQALFSCVDSVYLPDAVADYIARLVEETHPDAAGSPPVVKQSVRYGASPRAAIAIAEAARAHALLDGKANVGFSDVRAVAAPALGHRVVVDYRGKLDGVTSTAVVEAVLAATPELPQSLPREVSGG